jgi:hypothetical protein
MLMPCVRIILAELFAHMDRGRGECVQDCRCGWEGDTRKDIKEILCHGLSSIPVIQGRKKGLDLLNTVRRLLIT